MENLVNKVMLSGFAGADAEIKYESGDQKLATVRLAVNEYYKTAGGEEVKRTQWFVLSFWNAKADLAIQRIKKGNRLSVEGKLRTGSYENKEGIKHYTTEIIVTELNIKESELVN